MVEPARHQQNSNSGPSGSDHSTSGRHEKGASGFRHWMQRAREQNRAGDLDRAIESYRRALEVNDTSELLHREIGRAFYARYQKNGFGLSDPVAAADLKAAALHLETGCRNSGPGPVRMLIGIHETLGYDGRATYWRAKISEGGKSVKSEVGGSESSVRSRSADRASSGSAWSRLEQDPSNARLWIEKAREEDKAGNLDTAIESYFVALRFDGGNSMLHREVGRALHKRFQEGGSDPTDAKLGVQHLDIGYRDTRDTDHLLKLAGMLEDLGEFEKSCSVYMKTLEGGKFPTREGAQRFQILQRLGSAQCVLGYPVKGAKSLLEAANGAYQYAEAKRDKQPAEAEFGYGLAEVLYNESLRYDPSSDEASHNLLLLDQSKEEFDKKKEIRERLSDGKLSSYYELAQGLDKQGRRAEALEVLVEGLKIHSDPKPDQGLIIARMMRLAGQLENGLGNRDSAKNWYIRAAEAAYEYPHKNSAAKTGEQKRAYQLALNSARAALAIDPLELEAKQIVAYAMQRDTELSRVSVKPGSDSETKNADPHKNGKLEELDPSDPLHISVDQLIAALGVHEDTEPAAKVGQNGTHLNGSVQVKPKKAPEPKITSENEKNPDAWMALSDWRDGHEDVSGAIEALQNALELEYPSPEGVTKCTVLRNLAELSYKDMKVEQAVGFYTDAAKLALHEAQRLEADDRSKRLSDILDRYAAAVRYFEDACALDFRSEELKQAFEAAKASYDKHNSTVNPEAVQDDPAYAMLQRMRAARRAAQDE